MSKINHVTGEMFYVFCWQEAVWPPWWPPLVCCPSWPGTVGEVHLLYEGCRYGQERRLKEVWEEAPPYRTVLSLSRSQSLGRGGEEEEKAVAVGSCWSTAVKSGTKARLKPLKGITGSIILVQIPLVSLVTVVGWGGGGMLGLFRGLGTGRGRGSEPDW